MALRKLDLISTGIFLPIPFGILADRIGRKKILLFSLCGLFLEFLTLGAICE